MATMFRLAFVTIIWLQIAGSAGELVNLTTMSRLSLDPAYLYVTPNGTTSRSKVILKCDEPNNITLDRYEIKIDKCEEGGCSNIVLARYYSQGTTPKLKGSLPSSTGLKEINGSYLDGFLKISFVEAVCEDEAEYYCQSAFIIKSGEPNVRDPATLYLPVNGPVTLTLSPENTSTWILDDEVTLNCTGPAPKDRTRAQVELVWKFRDPGTNTWFPFELSHGDTGSPPRDLTNVTNVTSQLTNDIIIVPSGVEIFAEAPGEYCNHTVSEVMRFRLRKEDDGREFRCYALLNSVGYPQYGDSVTIASVDWDGKDDENTGGPWIPALVGVLCASGGLLLLGMAALACCYTRQLQQPDDAVGQGPGAERDYAARRHRKQSPASAASTSASAPDETTGSEVTPSMSQITDDFVNQ